MTRKLTIIINTILIIFFTNCSLGEQPPAPPPDTTPPENCTKFKVGTKSSTSSGYSHLNISWTDPDDADLSKIIIIINQNTDNLILEIPKGQQTYTIQEVPQAKFFRFIYYAEDNSGNRSNINQYTMNTTDYSRFVNDFEAEIGDSIINLTWKNPDYQGFDKLIFWYYKDGYDPVNWWPKSNEIIERELPKDTAFLSIDNLKNGRGYMFYLKTVDTDGNFSSERGAGGIPSAPPVLLGLSGTYTTEDGLLDNKINDIYVSQDGTIAVATPRGVSVWDGTNWINYDKNAVPDTDLLWIVKEVYMAENGTIYAGNNDGLFVFDGTQWLHYSKEAGLANDNIWGLIGDAAGNIYCGTRTGGIYLFADEKFDRISKYSDPSALDIDVDSLGNLYAADSHLYIYNDKKWDVHYSHHNGIVRGDIRDVFALSSDKIIVGSYAGLSVYNGSTWTTYTTEDGLISNGITCVSMTEDGKLYAGTEAGLAYYDGIEWKNFTSSDWSGKNGINNIFVDSKGKVYIATDVGLTITELP